MSATADANRAPHRRLRPACSELLCSPRRAQPDSACRVACLCKCYTKCWIAPDGNPNRVPQTPSGTKCVQRNPVRPLCARDESPIPRISSFPEKSFAFTDARHWLLRQSISPFYREVGNERNLCKARKQVFSAKDRLDLEIHQRPPVSLWRKPSGANISETCGNVRNHTNPPHAGTSSTGLHRLADLIGIQEVGEVHS